MPNGSWKQQENHKREKKITGIPAFAEKIVEVRNGDKTEKKHILKNDRMMTLPSGERSRDSFDLTEYENAYNEFSGCLYDRSFSSNQLFICESRARSYSSIYTTFPFCEIGYFNRNLGNWKYATEISSLVMYL